MFSFSALLKLILFKRWNIYEANNDNHNHNYKDLGELVKQNFQHRKIWKLKILKSKLLDLYIFLFRILDINAFPTYF